MSDTRLSAHVYRAGEGERRVLIGQLLTPVVRSEETAGLFTAVVASGPRGGPIPLHHHEIEHETWFVTEGKVQLWADGESRVLCPGDFGSVPPGSIHAYQFLGHHTRFLSFITPAGFERFFHITAEPYDQYVYPVGNPGPPPIDRFMRAQGEMRMSFAPRDMPYAPATLEAPDDQLAGALEPYFLAAGEGPRLTLLGQMFTFLARGEETDGEMTIFTAEGPRGATFPAHRHERAHLGLWCLDGTLRATVDGEEVVLAREDFLHVPAGCSFAYEMGSHWSRFLAVTAPSGFEAFVRAVGEPYPHHVYPAGAVPAPSLEALAAAGPAHGITFDAG